MTQKRLIQISDLHLSRTRAYMYPNWQAIVAYINETQPDLVICTGDFVLDAPEDIDDLHFGRQELDKLTVPWRALPGDHDIGGGPPAPRQRPEAPWLARYGVTEERRRRYLNHFDVDSWALPFGDWTFIGINDLIFESGFAAEQAQWTFLEQQLALAGNRPVALFMHKPPCVISLAETDSRTKAIPVAARERIRHLVSRSRVRLIGAGHLHVYRTIQTMGITVVMAPTLMRGANDYTSNNGQEVNGLVEYTFAGEGVEMRLVQPPQVTRPQLPLGPRHLWPECRP